VGGGGGVERLSQGTAHLDIFKTLNGQPVHPGSNNHSEQHEQQRCGTNPRTHRVGTDMQPQSGGSESFGHVAMLSCYGASRAGFKTRLTGSSPTVCTIAT